MQPTVLIVDDEKHTRDGLRSLLGDKYDTYVAADIGERARRPGARSDRSPPDRSAPRRRGRDDPDRARAQAAASAGLHHDDGLRFGRHRGRGDEARRLRFRDQAAQSRQGRDVDRARAWQPPTRAGESRAAPAGGRTFRPREHPRRIARAARSARHHPAGRAFLGQHFDRRRKRHGQGAGRARDS